MHYETVLHIVKTVVFVEVCAYYEIIIIHMKRQFIRLKLMYGKMPMRSRLWLPAIGYQRGVHLCNGEMVVSENPALIKTYEMDHSSMLVS